MRRRTLSDSNHYRSEILDILMEKYQKTNEDPAEFPFFERLSIQDSSPESKKPDIPWASLYIENHRKLYAWRHGAFQNLPKKRILLFGPKGAGKTSLLQAVQHYSHDPGSRSLSLDELDRFSKVSDHFPDDRLLPFLGNKDIFF